MSSLLEQGKDELGKAREKAMAQLKTRIPGRRSGPSAAVDRTTSRARNATHRAEKLVSGARSLAKDGIERTQRGKQQRRRKRIGKAAAAGAAGGAGAYFLAPSEGKRRRDIVRGKVTGLVRRAAPAQPAPNDETLADRVRSEIFRPAEVPKGSVNVNVEDGIVYLRGDADDETQIRKLVENARSVDGVREVKNLISTS